MSYPRAPGSVAWLFAAAIVGCGPAEEPAPSWTVDPADCRPVSGVVKLKGKPLPSVVVAFFSASGVPSSGETDKEGRYTLRTMEHEGVPPGEYKVVLSYYLAPDGTPQGLSARSAMVQSQAMREAKESLPPKYSDVNKTELKAVVNSSGNVLDFDLDADPVPPKPEAPPAGADKTGTPAPK